MSPIDVEAVGAKRSDMKFAVAMSDNDYTEMRTDGDGSWKKRFHLFGSRVGGDIIIVRLFTADHVTDASTRVERGEAGVLQTLNHLTGGVFERSRHIRGGNLRRPGAARHAKTISASGGELLRRRFRRRLGAGGRFPFRRRIGLSLDAPLFHHRFRIRVVFR